MPIGIAKANVEAMRRQADYEERRDALREQRRVGREERQRQSDMGALPIHAKQLEAQQRQPAAGALGKAPAEQAAPPQPQAPQVPSFLDALNEQKVLKFIRENDPALANIQRARIGAGGELFVQDDKGVDGVIPAERFAALWQAAQLSGLQPKTYSQKLAAERFALTKEKWEREKDVLDKREARLSKMISPVEKQRLVNSKDRLRLLIDQSKNIFDEEEQKKLQAKLAVAWDAYTGMMDQFDEQYQGTPGAMQAAQPPAVVPSPEPFKALAPMAAEEEAERLRATRREREAAGQAAPKPTGSIETAGRDMAKQLYVKTLEMFAGKWNPANPNAAIKKTFDETWRKTGLPASEAPHYRQMLDATDKLAKNKSAAPSERIKAKAAVSVMSQQVKKDVEMTMSGLDDPDEIWARHERGEISLEEAERLSQELRKRGH